MSEEMKIGGGAVTADTVDYKRSALAQEVAKKTVNMSSLSATESDEAIKELTSKLELAPKDYLKAIVKSGKTDLGEGPKKILPKQIWEGIWGKLVGIASSTAGEGAVKVGSGGKFFKTIRIPKFMVSKKVITSPGKRNPFPSLYMGFVNFIWYSYTSIKPPPIFMKIAFAWAKAQMGIADYYKPGVTDWATFLKTLPAGAFNAYMYKRNKIKSYDKAMREKRGMAPELRQAYETYSKQFNDDPGLATTIFLKGLYGFAPTENERKYNSSKDISVLANLYTGDKLTRKRANYKKPKIISFEGLGGTTQTYTGEASNVNRTDLLEKRFGTIVPDKEGAAAAGTGTGTAEMES